mgnify:CR=1 FL=1
METNKQSSIEWFAERIKSDRIFSFEKVLEQAKAKHKQEIEEAYDRKVIGDIQNWYIRDGKHYYELHYQEEQVGETGRENK